MPGNRRSGRSFPQVAGLFFLAALLLALFYVLFFNSGQHGGFSKGRDSDSATGDQGFGSSGPSGVTLTGSGKDGLTPGQKTGPGLRNLPLMSGFPNRSTSRAAHNLPDEYFVPPSPQATLEAMRRISELRDEEPASDRDRGD